MSERRYTITEIDALRDAVEHKYLFGRYDGAPGREFSRTFREEEKAKSVEEQVRTLMLAGLTAQDLLDSEAPAP